MLVNSSRNDECTGTYPYPHVLVLQDTHESCDQRQLIVNEGIDVEWHTIRDRVDVVLYTVV